MKENIKVLIVEDDWTSFIYLSRVFESFNFTVLHAENGAIALKLAGDNPDISLVMMDIKMPVMDGFEATTKIKSILPNAILIAQTAYAFSDEREKIMALGCDEFIAKPVEYSELLKLIEKYK